MENLERFIGEYYIYDKMPKEQVLEICAKILEHTNPDDKVWEKIFHRH